VGNTIRVNLPKSGNRENYLRIDIYGDKVYGEFKCCPTRSKVDGALDKLGGDISKAFNKPWARDVKCLIWGMTGCEE
jgi:hypothetical protein